MEFKQTHHSYYCSDNNYYVGNYHGENWGRSDYRTWKEFKKTWFYGDHDLNHCFRFDIRPKSDSMPTRYSLELFFILQRKGIFCPVYIEEIYESDLLEIEQYLKSCWKYLKNQWKEFSDEG